MQPVTARWTSGRVLGCRNSPASGHVSRVSSVRGPLGGEGEVAAGALKMLTVRPAFLVGCLVLASSTKGEIHCDVILTAIGPST